jgi:anti-anti-sigma factor
MPMKIGRREQNGVTILDLAGKMTLEEGSHQLRNAVHEEASKGSHKLLLNCAEVTSVDSSGIGEFISSHTTAQRDGGKVKLLNVPPRVNDLLVLTQLNKVFETYDDEKKALASF